VAADLFLGLLTLGFAGLGVLALSSVELGSAAFLLAVSLFFGTITALSLSTWRLRGRVPPGSVALEMTGSRCDGVRIAFSAWLYYGLMVILRICFACTAAYAAGGILSWEVPPYLPRADALSRAISGVGALFCLWLFIEFASGRIARGHLTLTTDGIYHRSHTFEHFLPWSAMLDVSAVQLSTGPFIAVEAGPSGDTQVRRTHWMGKQLEFRLLPFLMVRGRSLGVDPALVYHALRYYLAHPDARAELLTSAGEQRIRGGHLLD
jgi:hypothetical protein